MAVASGMHDVVLAAGAEKMTDLDDASGNAILDSTADAEWEASMGVTFPSLHAMIANRMIHDGIATREEIASFAVKNRAVQFRNMWLSFPITRSICAARMTMMKILAFFTRPEYPALELTVLVLNAATTPVR